MRGRRSAKAVPEPIEGATRHRLARLPRVRPRQPDTRAAPGPALGALGPPCEELAADPARSPGEARTGAEARAERLLPRAATERREATPRAPNGGLTPP